MHFQFIDNNSKLCHATKRKIRTHAAKEKNLGRTVFRPSKKNELSRRRELVSLLPPRVIASSSSPESEQEVPLKIGRQVGDGLSVLSFMSELSQEPRELVQKAVSLFNRVHYMRELRNAFEAHSGPPSMWFQLVLEDEAYFHVFMAMCAVAFNNTTIEEDDPMSAVRHLNKTFLLTNQRLSRTDAVSDASIAVVVMMAQYERQRDRYIKGLTHVDGLQLMVGLRGGISQLARENPSLCQKIIRLDLDYALYLGTTTRFSVPEVEAACKIWSGFCHNFRRHYELRPSCFAHLIELGAELQDLAVDMTYLSWLLNDANAGRRPALDARGFHGALLLIGYRLVRFSPLGRLRPVCHLQNAVHLGLVAFMMPFMYLFDGKVPDCSLLAQSTHLAVEQSLSTDESIQETLLWILLVGAASVLIQPLNYWVLPLVSQIMHSLHLYSWEDVSRVMAKYPWIDAYQNDPGRIICEDSIFCDQVSLAATLRDSPASSVSAFSDMSIYTDFHLLSSQ